MDVRSWLRILHERFISLDLGASEASKVTAGLELSIPFNNPVQRANQRHQGTPRHLGFRFGYVELKIRGFMRMRGLVLFPGRMATPQSYEPVCNPRHGFGVGVLGAKIPRSGEARGIFCEVFCKEQVTVQRLENELPWPNGERAADNTGLLVDKSSHEIGKQLIPGPVPAADNIAGSGSGD